MSIKGTDALAQSGLHHYKNMVRFRLMLLGALGVALLCSLCVDLSVGPAQYPLGDVIQALLSPDQADIQVATVIWEIRMPVAVIALVVGASLSVAGAQMQTILNNPLASPFTLGISAAASFGAALALAFGWMVFPAATQIMVPFNAFVMAMATACLIYLLSMRRGVTVQTIVLLGIALVFSFNALLSLVQFLASSEALSAVVFWTMGSLTKATWTKVAIITLVLVCVLPVFGYRAWALTAMRLGDEKAASFGVKVGRLRLETLLLVSLLSAVSVAFVGAIGFIGLVGPHIARMLIAEDQRFFLPASALCGALILSLSSIASKLLLTGAILPIGIVTSLVGIPFFVILIFSNTRQSW